MSMSKKDYVAIATVLNKIALEHDLDEQQCFGQAVIDLSALFATSNPKFLPSLFFEAVYIGVPDSQSSGSAAPNRVSA